ncbi:hypothetical protein POTOM_032433 [Populus tomentosa]|uniref:Reverse transcriptase domain-containing protein n=1 Tax=Populus tomentosa TaxID=118781 RepID=A0A8X7Z4F8_POPTO|nr:hypothetical protein POTOM_032433 [Populus tomentosa]
MHNYHLNNGAARCALKVDLRKAFDTVSWEFILAGLQAIDDLMLFYHADTTSVGILKDSLNKFSSISGLKINLAKSSIYLTGIGDNLKGAIRDQVGFQQSALPDVSNSSNSCFSIQVYWSTMFILPCSSIRKLESILAGFLWKWTSLNPCGAKVAWHSLCFPKKEGSLGLKRLKVWNKAAVMKQIWNILGSKSSVNSDASPSHQVKGNASPATNTDDKQLNVDASTSHQDKGNAITSLATNTDEMSSEESDSSGETDTDSSDETDTDESASDSSDESQLKPSDLGDVNPITPPLSINNHVRTSPLELPMCITSKQMALPSSSETSSSSQVPPINLPKMTPSRAHPLESISIAQSVGCDDTGFTLVTRRKKKKDIPEMKTRVATHRVAPSFLPSS